MSSVATYGVLHRQGAHPIAQRALELRGPPSRSTSKTGRLAGATFIYASDAASERARRVRLVVRVLALDEGCIAASNPTTWQRLGGAAGLLEAQLQRRLGWRAYRRERAMARNTRSLRIALELLGRFGAAAKLAGDERARRALGLVEGAATGAPRAALEV